LTWFFLFNLVFLFVHSISIQSSTHSNHCLNHVLHARSSR
ncbi:hypothetical protein C369_00903, partial [Cryptococcus neoformans A5-35-17]